MQNGYSVRTADRGLILIKIRKTSISKRIALLAFPLSALHLVSTDAIAADSAEYGDRPAQLIAGLPDGELRSTLQACAGNTAKQSLFSIAHRGAPLGYPEHTREGYIAAAKNGAGIIECDVTFTRDQELVCRHSQCDLHTTTNILATPLAQKCSVPPDMSSNTPFSDVKCCASDLTVTEFKSLEGRFDSVNKKAGTLAEYLSLEGTPHAQSAGSGTLLTHAESIELFKSLGVKMIPELKAPQVPMPFSFTNGTQWTQEQYAQALVDEYRAHSVAPSDVYLQSFDLDDVKYWINNEPEFGKQAAWLDGRYRDRSFNVAKPRSWDPSMDELVDAGLTTLAPPIWMMLDLDKNKNIVPSSYAKAASESGLELIGWTLERSGSLENGGGWYYQTIKPAVKNDSAMYQALHVLAEEVGVRGVFSDWPATTTYYANCFGKM